MSINADTFCKTLRKLKQTIQTIDRRQTFMKLLKQYQKRVDVIDGYVGK